MPSKKPTRYAVEEEAEGIFRVVDTVEDRNVDGPFSRRELAEARAAKREGQVTKTYGWAAEE